MRNIRLTIEYDGKCYNGWQKQPDKLNIQGEIERAIFNITKEEVNKAVEAARAEDARFKADIVAKGDEIIIRSNCKL